MERHKTSAGLMLWSGYLSQGSVNSAMHGTSPVIVHTDEITPYTYEIDGLLGRGAFGLVYSARLVGPEGFQRPVALKVLKPDHAGTDELVERLRGEARAMARLNHPSFIRVDRLVRLELGWAMVMERVDGVNLRRLLDAVGRAPLGPALEIAALVAGALHVAWTAPDERGRPIHLLHRDLKPSNLMLTPFGEVKILDLGIARDQRDLDRTSACALGTPDYAAPERFDGREGPEADVYSLAVVLYELLTGERYGLASPVREHHDARWREALGSAREALRGRGGVAEPVCDLLRFSLAFHPSVRPPADAFEAACLAVRAALPDEALRVWAGRVVRPLLADLVFPLESLDDEELPTDCLNRPDAAASAPAPGEGVRA